MNFSIATYNTLANAYIRREWYPHTDPQLMRPEYRGRAVAARLTALAVDLLCLQEVEPDTFAIYAEALAGDNYTGRFTQRPGKPDGCAIFLRRPRCAWAWHEQVTLDPPDASRMTRRIAQLAVVDVDGRRLGIVNAHLEWDAPDADIATLVGPRQAARLLAARSAAPACTGWVICGDFNATVESRAVQSLISAGFTVTHGATPPPTCNANQRARAIDYIFHDSALIAAPCAVTPVADEMALPRRDEPSDHVPVGALLSWSNGL